MKILFVTSDLGYTDSIAIAFLSAIAKQLNHSTYYCSLDGDCFLSKIEEIKPKVVGYSVNIYGYKRIIVAHKQAKKVHKFTSIMGGPHPTTAPETFPDSGMDAYCIGEGEYAFRDFLIRVEKGKPFDDIANLITKKRHNTVRPLIENLDELPMPDRDLVFSNTFHKTSPKKTFFASRGCPFSCSYCCNNVYRKLYKGKGKYVRRFSVERILNEIEDVKEKYTMEFVKFDDDCFSVGADSWLEEFAEKYPKRIGIPFNCVLRFDYLDDKLIHLLKKAGCYSVHLSVDSSSSYIRKNILNRRMKNVDIVKKLKKIRESGIRTWVNFMSGVPESTLNDEFNSISMGKKGKVTYVSYTTTSPMIGTDLYDYCVKKGYINEYLYEDDPPNFFKPSSLSCFSERDKKIRYNICLLGAFIAKLPFPLDKIVILMIQVIPPNEFFRKFYDFFFEYYISHEIYKLSTS